MFDFGKSVSKITQTALYSGVALNLVFSLICPQASLAGTEAKPQHDQSNLASLPTSVGTNHKRLRALVHIAAPPDVVWYAIHEERNHDPDIAYSKILARQNERECELEQKFQIVPIFGTAVCRMKNIEVPNERIDYWLLGSDHFKALEGSWILTPTDSGRATTLELNSFIDFGMPLPRVIFDRVGTAKLEKRLANVKRAAEKAHQAAIGRISSL